VKEKTSRQCNMVKQEKSRARREQPRVRITLSNESRRALMRIAHATEAKRARQTEQSETCRTGRALMVAKSRSAPHERYLATGELNVHSSHSSQASQGFRLPSIGLLMQNPS
jgi:cytochrome c